MLPNDAKVLLPIITAFAEGKSIQHQDYRGTWRDSPTFDFSDDPDKYRIKPEPKVPRVLYVNMYKDDSGCHLAYDEYRNSQEAEGRHISERSVRFIEVIEDEST